MDVGAEKRKIYKNLWFPVDFPLNKSVDNRFSDFLCLKHLAWTPVLRKQEVAPVVEGPKIAEQPAVVKPKKEKCLDGKEPGGSINEDTPIAGWFMMEIPLKWMINRNTSISGNFEIWF